MHIAFVCDEYPPAPHGGIGSVTRNLAEGVVAAGHKVTVVGMSTTQPVRLECEEMLHGVRVVRLPALPRSQRRRLTSWWERLRLRRRLRRLHKEAPVDVLESPDYEGWLPDGGIPGVPTVVRIHGSNLFFDHALGRTPSLRAHALERRCLAHANFFAAVSQFAGRRTLELAGLGGRSCTVIHNAVDTTIFSPGNPQQVEAGLVVYVNTLNPKKGTEQLIDAANELLALRKTVRLVVIGEDTQHYLGGAYLEGLRARVAPEVRGRVTFTGRLSRDEIIPWLRAAAVCCHPSLMETFGIAPLEAMAVGRPVVYMKHGPGLEVIEDGVSGLLCDSHDPHDICRCLLRIIDSPDFAAELGRNARMRVERLFDQRAWIERNLRFYERCAQWLSPENIDNL